jgi:hypothetical protein
MPVVPIVFVAFLFSPLATAEIYRWVDPQGNVHFDARRRPGAEQIEVRPQVVERDEATRARETRAERFFEARRQEQLAADQADSERYARREQECRQLREDLSRLSRGGRYFRADAKGERVYYSDEEIAAARRQLASRISQNCS